MSTTSLTSVTPLSLAKSQQQSRLLCLSAELRLMILRELLVHPGAIKAREEYEKSDTNKMSTTPEPTTDQSANEVMGRSKTPEVEQSQNRIEQSVKEVQGYHLTPAILRTCQILFWEGLPLLYSENTLGLNGNKTQFCGSILAYGRDPMLVIDAHDGNILIDMEWNYGPGFWNSKMLNDAQKFAARFSRFEIDMPIDESQFVGSRLRKFISKLQSRLIKSNSFVHIKLADAGNSQNAKLARNIIKKFTVVRCKEFRVTGCGCGEELSKEVAELVMSDKPIINLGNSLARLNQIRNYLLLVSKVNEPAHELFGVLVQAVDNIDVEAFEATRSKILELFRAEIEKLNKMQDGVFKDDTWRLDSS